MPVTTLVSGTIVFTDIVGFTQLTDEHGDDVALTLLERQEAGKSLTANERAEAKGLLDIAEYFVVQRLRRRLAA